MILSVRWDLWKAVKIAHMVFGLSRREKNITTSQEVPMPKQKKTSKSHSLASADDR